MQKELAPAASAVSLMWRQRGAAFGVLFLVAAAAASPSLDPSSVFTGSSSPSAAASEQQRSPAGAEGGASAAAGQCAAAGGECGASQQDEAENRIHKLADGMQQQSSGAAGSREAAQALSWWDALMLALLLLLVLSSSASVFSGSSFESCCLRLCQAWPPLRRFLRLRKRSRVKLQILAAQYERVCEERARLAPRWFFAKQAENTAELNYLKKQACKIEKALQKIRSRHAKQLAESGVLRMLTRFFSKSKRPGEAATSSDSSDSEAWSTSTVESLLQQRLHADAADSSPSASSSACFSSSLSSHVGEQQEEADIASEGQPSAATRRPAAARPSAPLAARGPSRGPSRVPSRGPYREPSACSAAACFLLSPRPSSGASHLSASSFPPKAEFRLSPLHAIPAREVPAARQEDAQWTTGPPAGSGGPVGFTCGLPDSALPPETDSPPLVDLSLCRADFVSSMSPQLPPQQPACSSLHAANGSSDVVRVVPAEGPLAFFDSRKELHPSLTGASGDAYFINLYGPLQLGAAEVAQSALAAAKRCVRTLELRGLRRPQQHTPAAAAAAAAGEGGEHQQGGLEQAEYMGKGLEGAVRSVGGELLVGSLNLSALLREDRFKRAPYWLVERVAHSLKRQGPPSFGFLVAQLLAALCSIAATERQLGCTLDSYVARRMQTFRRQQQQMDKAAHALLLTSGSPRAFNDVLKFRRGFPIFPWGMPDERKVTFSFMQRLGVEEEALTQHFFSARRRAAKREWAAAVRYRIPEKEIPEDCCSRQLYEGFNSAAIACIRHVTLAWHRPVYIISQLERTKTVRRLLQAMGLPREALQRVHIFGADGFLMGGDADGQRPQNNPPGVCTQQPLKLPLWHSVDGAALHLVASWLSCLLYCPWVSEQASGISAKLNAMLAFWEYHKTLGLRGVPHLVEDDICVLRAAEADSRMEDWRLYFCDWGFSSYAEKLQAVISDRQAAHEGNVMVKVLPTMARLADLLLTPAYLPARLWASGSTAAPAEWLEEGRMARWLRLAGALQPVRQPQAEPRGTRGNSTLKN
ncbi:hypothetical protein Efla_004126 [Eimeria flavescens]